MLIHSDESLKLEMSVRVFLRWLIYLIDLIDLAVDNLFY